MRLLAGLVAALPLAAGALTLAGARVPGGPAELERPYEDPTQAMTPFGTISYYKDGWRSYMDTWPARRFLDIFAVNWTDVSEKETDPTMQLFSECGFRHFRCEIGWGGFSFDDPPRLSEHSERRLKALFEAARRHGVRPMILLNANSGMPTPSRDVWVELAAPAKAGDRELRLVGETPKFKTDRTGLEGQRYNTAYPLVVSVDGAVARLSAPLERDVPAGRLHLRELKYAPFSGDVFADGRPNPAAAETINGWLEYVKAVTSLARRLLGTEGAKDAGFDLEVWNEYTFGSEFLNERSYYSPPRKFSHYPECASGANRVSSELFAEIILPLTVAFVADPANRLPGVRVVSGFSNQRPWESGESMWTGQAGFSKHYYTGINPGMEWSGTDGLLSPKTENPRRLERAPIGADGRPDETRFIPTYRASFPESLFVGAKTETLSRDVEPRPNVMEGHYRYGHPGDGRAPLIWQTEYNTWRRPFAEMLEKACGVARGDQRLNGILDYMATKAFVRSSVFMCHKGVDTLFYYCSRGSMDEFAVLPPDYWRDLARAGYELTDGVRASSGGQMLAARRLVKLMRSGKTLDSVRAPVVERLVEHEPHLVFEGNGTLAAPSVHHRDDFAVLPFQLDERTYAIGFYVVTRDIAHPWDPSRDLLDPKRYEMPDQRFDVTFGNLAGKSAELKVLDPVTGEPGKAVALSSSASRLEVSLLATDHPRFLIVREAADGPLAAGISLKRVDAQTARFTFTSSVDGEATVEWGPFPSRAGAAKKLAVKKGARNELALEGFVREAGVRLKIAANGLECVWPRWDHDVAGRIEFAPPPKRHNERHGAGIEFPEGSARLKRDALPKDATFVAGGAAELDAALPTLAVSDNVMRTYTVRDGVPVCRIEYRLDGTMHPGARELAFAVEIQPAEGGYSVLREVLNIRKGEVQ